MADDLLPCGCRKIGTITNPERHAAWHEEIEREQAENDPRRAGRGPTLSGETILDERARASGKRASGALRRASHG